MLGRFLSTRLALSSLKVRSNTLRHGIILNATKMAPTISINMVNKFHSSIKLEKIVPFNLADIGEGITECELIQWFVKEGDNINQFDRICEVQSDKASVEITSRYDGIITKLHCETGGMAKVGEPLVDIDTQAEGSEEEDVKQPIKEEKKSIDLDPIGSNNIELSDRVEASLTFATPAVRRIAKENSIELNKVNGSGKGGRVMKEDILAYLNELKNPSSSPIKATTAPTFTPAPISLAPATSAEEIKPLSMIQKAMFKAMTGSLSIPHFGYSDEFNLNHTSSIRGIINQSLTSNDNVQKISYMPIFIKTLSIALMEYPILNARLVQSENDLPQLAYRHQHNIGIAMDTKQGLIVPNIKDVQSKSILQIAEELQHLQKLGQSGQLTSDQLKNGTITLSNIGTVGGTYLNPVVVTSELCIGALGKMQKVPRYVKVNGEEVIKPHLIMPVSFSADHRVIDGATLARFVEKWRKLVEDPVALIAHLK